MKSFEYGDQKIGSKEIRYGVASMMIGVGVLTMPRAVAEVTQSSDGWISIVIASTAAVVFAWIAAKLASKFPNQSFFHYASAIASKPAAYLFTFVLFIYYVLFTSYVTRAIAEISKQYLFDETPVEVIALVFILVVIYAVSGSRAGLLRLNLLFFPFVVTIVAILLLFSLGLFEWNNLKPFMITNWQGIASGTKESIFSLLGFEIILFYIAYMNRPKQAPKAAVIGVMIPSLLYLCVYIIVIGVFSFEVTSQVNYPTIELAKEIKLPGQFFERYESLFFVIWIMTIFNTTSMAMDVSVMALSSMFGKWQKMSWILIISPFIYVIAMLPQNPNELFTFGSLISYMGLRRRASSRSHCCLSTNFGEERS